MANGRVISYLRVSTDRQGASGLGLEAQRAEVARYLDGGDGVIIAEFVEIESGKRSDRPKLAEALAMARLHRVALVVAKVDRLTRSLAFLSRLIEAGVDVRFCDMPKIEGPAGRFMLQQMASVAELEGGMISKRTKDALAAAKARGVKLGGVREGQRIDDEIRAAGRTAQTARANARAADVAPTIAELQAGGASLNAIAAELTARGIPTATGKGQWTAAGVKRVIDRAVQASAGSGSSANGTA